MKPRLLIADEKGRIYDVPYLEATGMKGEDYFCLESPDLVELHPDSELFALPDRNPVGYDPDYGEFVELERNPFAGGDESCSAVGAFLAPAYTATQSASYSERRGARILPLFSYSAVALFKGKFYAAGVRVDNEKRQELRGMDMRAVRKNVKEFRRIFPKNRLVRHLERCALCYGCPAAKNFFLKRYEGPLPTSPACNARCIGCISYQPKKGCSVTQPRITFVPTAEEVAEAALFHIRNVKDPVVSFGQGCEGEPLMVSDVLERAVKLIRRSTGKGVINLNTNASKPDAVRRLFGAGLDSIRVSMSSAREKYYNAYYSPRGYSFRDVAASIKYAKKAGGFVSINYLVMPGFTDSRKEKEALFRFLGKTKVDMIQWRNLNYDPAAYFKKLKVSVKRKDMVGIGALIKETEREFPRLMKGYFNPSRGRMKRAMKAKR
ncbi:MAG: radical SAM protein [Candidatus Omnitrophota bacterium]|jgi:MoaA/NifB/PqqE/SkfB family radical SAM enzyme